MNIRVDLHTPINDGTEVVFRSPVDCSQITGLIVYYREDGKTSSKVFALSDAHGNNVGDIDHLFAENVVVKVILDVTSGMAFVQNADTNAYIEKTFVKTINGKTPDENGNVEVAGGSGISNTEKTLIFSLFRNAVFTKDMSATINQLEALWNGSGDNPGEGGGDTGEDVGTYTVTNNLTDVTNSNSATTASGFYSASLSAEDGYTISVTITMGGVDITADVYTEDGTILITEVTGDIVITATAELATAPVLYQLANTPRTVNADLFEDTGLTFGSSAANGYTKAWTICVDVAVTTNQKALFGVNVTENAKCLYFQTNGAGVGQIYICNNNSAQTTANSENRHRFVITHVANASKVATVHRLTDGEVVSTEVTGNYGTFNYTSYAGNLHIGGRTAATFIGTINEFTIYDGVLSDAHIAEFLGVA